MKHYLIPGSDDRDNGPECHDCGAPHPGCGVDDELLCGACFDRRRADEFATDGLLPDVPGSGPAHEEYEP